VSTISARLRMREPTMRLSFPNLYDRADLLMSAGCSTFMSAALILAMPRVGIVILEVLLGLFLIGCALVARARLRRKATGEAERLSSKSGRRWFDRYDALIIAAVILGQSGLDPVLRHLGLSEGTRRIVPLVLLGIAILLKPRLVEIAERRKKRRQAIVHAGAPEFAAAELWWRTQAREGGPDEPTEEKGKNRC
jgi:hypothetical protein